jgi:hypothetical protein
MILTGPFLNSQFFRVPFIFILTIEGIHIKLNTCLGIIIGGHYKLLWTIFIGFYDTAAMWWHVVIRLCVACVQKEL